MKPSRVPREVARSDLSLVMPCYDEEDNVGYSIPKLFQVFESSGYRLQLVAVNNGSRDRTGEALADLSSRYPGLRIVTVEKNIGFGFGMLSGVPACEASWVGIVAADGQVDAEDTVRLFEAVHNSRSPVIAKVRRRFRMDGLLRKVVSVSYNLFARILWPKLGSWDLNGVPVILPRDVLLCMRLESTNWFTTAELLVKAHYLGIRVLELNVFARMRGNGLSHVRAATCWEFFKALVAYRLRPKPSWLHLPESANRSATPAESRDANVTRLPA